MRSNNRNINLPKPKKKFKKKKYFSKKNFIKKEEMFECKKRTVNTKKVKQ